MFQVKTCMYADTALFFFAFNKTTEIISIKGFVVFREMQPNYRLLTNFTNSAIALTHQLNMTLNGLVMELIFRYTAVQLQIMVPDVRYLEPHDPAPAVPCGNYLGLVSETLEGDTINLPS